MSKIIINPLTRISGFMELEVVIENSKIVDARTVGLFFRGFEKMLQGRNPFDAIYFTERICGICSSAHANASSMALESALGVIPTEQGRYLRDIIHGCEFLQNHIRHFYLYTLPDYVKLPSSYPLFESNHTDFKLPTELNNKMIQHYFDAQDISRLAHEAIALFGGKAPHNHGTFVGGITTVAEPDKIIKLKSLIQSIKDFVVDKMLPDALAIADCYREYFDNGQSYPNLMSYGCFDNYKELGTLYVNPGTYYDGMQQGFDEKNIAQNVDYSWYTEAQEPDQEKPGAYSWIKAPRYDGLPFETGPLARMWLSGEYKNGLSTMDRTLARVIETKKITEVIQTLTDNLVPSYKKLLSYEVPTNASGSGLVDTTRGSLGHWIRIENKKIDFYQIITPSAWNLSPKSGDGTKGPSEKALIGTEIENVNAPVEIGRIIRSFDPCVSCATHVLVDGKPSCTIQVMP